jgi:hypothetical protein
MLLGWLSDEERTELQTREFRERAEEHHDAPVESVSEAVQGPLEPPPAESALPVEDEVTQEISLAPPTVDVPLPNRQLGRIFPFGAESETPGFVVPFERAIRVVVEGYMLPRAIELPVDVVPKVMTGLEQLNVLQHRQARVDPALLCDRPDCAVYGRVGTMMNPNAVELRVWTGPTTSESVSFETIYLNDLLEGMRQSLDLMGYPLRSRAGPMELPSPPPAPLVLPNAPARMRPLAAARPLTIPGPIRVAELDAEPIVRLAVDLDEIQLGRHRVALRLRGYSHHPSLALEWEGQYFELPVDHLEELLTDLRALYYDALRGRRGRALEVGEYPVVTISVRNEGTQLYVWIQQEIDGEITALTFPASEAPILLNAARAALSYP